MVIFKLPPQLSEEFMGLIGEQRAMVNVMMAERILENYMLSLEANRLWVVVTANSEFEVRQHVEQLPLTQFMAYSVTELTMYNAANIFAPDFSLN